MKKHWIECNNLKKISLISWLSLIIISAISFLDRASFYLHKLFYFVLIICLFTAIEYLFVIKKNWSEVKQAIQKNRYILERILLQMFLFFAVFGFLVSFADYLLNGLITYYFPIRFFAYINAVLFLSFSLKLYKIEN